MDNNTFSYRYSAKENEEIKAIRKKYLPRKESKLEELKRLDRCVQMSGIVQSLTVGITGCLVFGLGLCLAMKAIGDSMLLGILLGVVGVAGMLAAYPVYRRLFGKTKAQLSPRILELAAELTDN